MLKSGDMRVSVLLLSAFLVGIVGGTRWLLTTRSGAMDRACHDNLREIQLDIERYASEHDGYYPSKLQQLNRSDIQPTYHEYGSRVCPYDDIGYLSGYTSSADRRSYRLKCPVHKAQGYEVAGPAK